MKRPSPPRNELSGILLCFFLSGAAGLIYQIAWGKALGLIFGHTVYAIATVLAVFMAGLAAGSAWIGRWSARHTEPIALYSRIEFLVAATAALSLVGLAGVRWFYALAYPVVSGSHPLLLALRFFGAAAVLFLPTFLMGGTLPVLVSGVMRNSGELALRVSQLYWINTLGAVGGTLLSGFVLLPTLGLRLTVALAVALNLLAGVIVLRIAKHDRALARNATAKTKSIASPAQLFVDSQNVGPNFLLFLFAAVGCTAFMYEIAWTRLLSIMIGSSTYSFTLMLATFLTGTVIGSAFFQRRSSRSTRLSIHTLSWTQLGIGITALSSLLLFRWIPSLIPPLLRATRESFSGLLLTQFVISALTVLPAAIIFGFNFPVVIALLGGRAHSTTGSSAVVGKAYAANTVGAIVGSVLAGFWLVPRLGSFRVVGLAAAVNLLLALALDLRRPQRRALPLITGFTFLLLALIISSTSIFYNRSLLSLSAVLYGNTYQGHLTLNEIAATNDLVFAAEGVNESIAVVRTDASVALRVNGKADASTGDARTQLLLGYLGAAFHPAPRRVLIIGFGGGMTASAVARYPDIEKIDCVEIEPAVLRAAPYLETLNRNVLNDPRVNVIFDDARNFLLTSRQQYDLIISEPSNPWIAGIASLFTDEYYAAARQRLAPRGIFVQWVQAYALRPDDLRMIAASFAPHFADVTLWRGEESDLLLMGRTDSAAIQFGHLRSLWHNQALKSDFESVDVHQPEGLAAYFLLDDSAVRRLAEGSALNTDDRTLLEYHAPQSLLTHGLADANQALIASLRSGPLPSNLESSEIGRALDAGAVTAIDLNDRVNADRFITSLKSQSPSAGHYIAQGRLALMKTDLSSAKSALEVAIKLEPDSLEAMHWLAVVEHRSGNVSAARSLVDQILKREPKYLPALQDELQFAADRKDFRAALHAQLQRMSLMPDPAASEYCRLGAIWMKISSLAEAEIFFRKGLQKEPYSYACHLGLGEVYRETGRFPLARQHFEWVVRFFPDTDPTTFRSLAGVYAVLGDVNSARSILRKGRRIFPDNSELQDAYARLGD